MSRRRWMPFVLAAAFWGCSSPDVVEIRGYEPDTILIAPVLSTNRVDRELMAAMDANVHRAVRKRGYDVIPVEVGARMLSASGWTDEKGLDQEVRDKLRRDFQVDTLLRRRVSNLNVGSAAEQPLFGVTWQLVDVANGSTIWSHSENGGGSRPSRLMVTGPVDYADDPFFSNDRTEGRDNADWTTELMPTTPDEQAENVQRRLAARLPYREK